MRSDITLNPHFPNGYLFVVCVEFNLHGREGVSCVNGQHSFFICTVRKGFTHLAYEINVDDNSISTEIFSSQIEVK